MYKINHPEITKTLKWLNYLKSNKSGNREVLENLAFEFKNDSHFITKTNGYALKTVRFSPSDFYGLELPQKSFLGAIYKQDKIYTDIIDTNDSVADYPNYKASFCGKLLKCLDFEIKGRTNKDKEISVFDAFSHYAATFGARFNFNVVLDLAKTFPADNLTMYKTDSEKVMYNFKTGDITCYGIVMPLVGNKKEITDAYSDINFYNMAL
jgi:hypothetical protein